MAVVLVPIVILAGWHDADDNGKHRVQTYFALILALESTIVFVFAATDLFLFYVAFEVMLFPVYFLIGMFGRGQRTYAAVKFLLYSLLGGLLLLAALIGLYVVSARELGQGTFDWTLLAGMHIDPATQKLLFAGFFFALAVKAPMVPVHTWLPDASASATPATSTLLVGVFDKVGTFAMLRLCLPIFPDASQWAAPFVVTLAVVSIVYGALVAIGQSDMSRLIAYTSVSHFGFIVLGIFAFTLIGGFWIHHLYGRPRSFDSRTLCHPWVLDQSPGVQPHRFVRRSATCRTGVGWLLCSSRACRAWPCPDWPALLANSPCSSAVTPALASGGGHCGHWHRAVGALHPHHGPACGARSGDGERQGMRTLFPERCSRSRH